MAISRIQSKIGSGSGTSITVTPTSGPTAGNLQVIAVTYLSSTSNRVSSISQTNCTWSRAVQSNNTSGVSTDLWYSMNAGSSPGTSITVTLASSQTYSYAYVEYSGVATTSALDQTASSQDTETGSPGPGGTPQPQTGTTPTTGQANEVCIGVIGFDSNYTISSANNSFTVVGEASSAPDIALLERIVSSTGAYGSIITYGGATPTTWYSAGTIATFKQASTASKGSGFFLYA